MLDPIDEIKGKLDIVDLVSQYTPLKKAGRSFKGLCPFHKEKTPSFIVSPDKQIAYCFGCHKGGDIFRFIMEMERVEFPDALRTLAKRTGVQLSSSPKPEDTSLRNRLRDMQTKARDIFVKNLFSPQGKKALDYLRGRGLSDDDIKEFSLGFAQDSYEAVTHEFLAQGYSRKELVQSGLVAMKEFSEDSLYDKFRNRVMFSIADLEDEVVAFAGRVLDDALPKYLNSPETPIYHKSHILYNLNKAKDAIREQGFVLIVEGYMDAISVYLAGIKNVVAVCGTALTEEQVKLLKRFTTNIYFCFDGDAAGVEAMKRNALPVIQQGLILKAIPLKTYKDPDEYVRKDKQGFLDLLAKPIDFMHFLIQLLESQYDINTLEGRKILVSDLFPLLKAFPVRVERDLYIKKLADLLGTTVQSISSDLDRTKVGFSRGSTASEEPALKRFELSDYLIGLLALHPDFFPQLLEKLPGLTLQDEFAKNIYTALQNQYNSTRRVDWDEIGLNEEQKERLNILKVLIEHDYGEEEESHQTEFSQLIARYQQEMFRAKQRDYLVSLKKAKDESEDNYRHMLREYHLFLDSYRSE